MFLSAVLFAAALQGAPQIVLKGDHAAGRSLPVGELSVAPGKVKSSLFADAPELRRLIAPSPSRTFKIGPPRPSRKKDFVFNPQTVYCRSTAPELVSSSDALLAVPLSKMPKARGERAVARLVDGCPVAVPVVQQAQTF